jgi:cobalamin biosynthesis protein CobD/CbiB
MIDYNALFEFSRSHCISICAFLVPANLLTTTNTLILTGLRRPPVQVLLAAGVAALLSGVMVLHVLTWFLIGVVMPPTFVLLFLGSVCLLANLWAVLARKSMARLLVTIYRICTRVDLLVFRQLHE